MCFFEIQRELIPTAAWELRPKFLRASVPQYRKTNGLIRQLGLQLGVDAISMAGMPAGRNSGCRFFEGIMASADFSARVLGLDLL